MRQILLLFVLICTLILQVGCASTTLSRAAVDGDLPKVQQFIKEGRDVNEFDGWGWTPLHWAVYYGNTSVTKWLLDNGSDPNIKTTGHYGRYSPGTTALILAAYYGHHEAVDALLKHKADPNVIDNVGKKALDYAQEFNFNESIKLLKPVTTR